MVYEKTPSSKKIGWRSWMKKGLYSDGSRELDKKDGRFYADLFDLLDAGYKKDYIPILSIKITMIIAPTR